MGDRFSKHTARLTATAFSFLTQFGHSTNAGPSRSAQKQCVALYFKQVIPARKFSNRSGAADRYSTLVASSAEILTRVEDEVVTNRPLAEVRRRGQRRKMISSWLMNLKRISSIC